MSSKGRGPRLGGANETYPTPSWCLEILMNDDRFISSVGARDHHPGGYIAVEPACGDLILADTWNLRWPFTSWLAYDIRPLPAGCYVKGSFYCCDFLTSRRGSRRVELVLTNPPYSVAEDFIRRSRLLYPNSSIVMLLRLSFLASASREGLYQDFGIPDVYVLPNRPSFVGKGTDSCDYAWFVWSNREGFGEKVSRLACVDKGARRG